MVNQVLNENETIRFMVDKQEITYTVDMLRATHKLPVETTEQPFIEPANLKFIQPFLKIVSYQHLVDKVSAFYTKNLAQPWQTMFKVFNRCITSRTSGNDQTKINILQIFHVVVNKVNVDYASLMWWDFLHYFESVPKRLEEEYHSIKDDTPLVSVYTTRKVTIKGMLIPPDLITDEIRETREYKDYAKEFVGKKEKRAARETSSPRPSLNIRVRQQKYISTTSIPPPKQENVAAVEEQLLKDDVVKIVECEDEESLEPKSQKENQEEVVVNDDDDEEEKKDDKKDDDNDDDTMMITMIMH
ncbi:hypothetical protein Tco_0613969 [Tanacetum coccineum]